MAGSLGPLLLDLYRLTRCIAAHQFVESALELVKAALPFDSALWGTFSPSPGGARVHSVHLHRQPERMMSDYEHVKEHDWVHRKVLGDLGHTFNIDLTRFEKKTHPAAVRHCRRYGMEHTLATVLRELPLNLFTAISLYRSDPKRPFSEGERRLKQELMPHLVEAWHMNALHLVDTPADPPLATPRARARVDAEGVVHNAEPGFAELLGAEFPGWEGPSVPPPLVALIGSDSGRYQGEALVVSLLRRLNDLTCIISARPVAPIDRLTPREQKVAREFASGSTYKDIAELLGSSPSTVRTQLRSAYAKLGVSNKVELVRALRESE